MNVEQEFWVALDRLVAGSTIHIDRPKGSAHPRYPGAFYPLDYGYLAGTTAGDGHGIDVWVGSLPEGRPNAIVCTVDLWKRDAEIKILKGCTDAEIETVLGFLNSGSMRCAVVRRKDT
ncbi:MAG TPA: hypothetical protein VEQ85_02735 [Lacipirellulaceae bacterium]|nr:hypothetical protein [Lacipirellulaceae bacterium]